MTDEPAPTVLDTSSAPAEPGSRPRMHAIVVLVALTAVWGVTFVQVKDAVVVYPLFAFLALRFAIASSTLAPAGFRRLRTLGAGGVRAGALAGSLLAAGYVLQTAGLQRTSVSSAGFITGLQVVLTPLIALALFRARIGLLAWAGVVVATLGLALLSGVQGGSAIGDVLVLAGAAGFALQIALMERYASRFDAIAFTLVEMLAAFAGLAVVAAALGDLRMPHGWTVWAGLMVTGVLASALGFLAQTWAQQRATATQTALVFTVEPVWTAFFGFMLAGDRLRPVAWLGCILIMAGISVAEPVAARVVVRLARRPRPRPVLTSPSFRRSSSAG
jgi:drug/metabolite transporter (DMT)-like permease